MIAQSSGISLADCWLLLSGLWSACGGIVLSVFVPSLLAAALWDWVWWHQIVRGWAEHNGLELVRLRRRRLRTGPFFWSKTIASLGLRRHHAVFRITVRSPDGVNFNGWYYMWASLWNHVLMPTYDPFRASVEILWDGRSPPTHPHPRVQEFIRIDIGADGSA